MCVCVHASVCVLVNECVGVGVTPPETAEKVVDTSEVNELVAAAAGVCAPS